MWLHTGRLPHVLEPRRYHDREAYARELEALFAPSWHLVTTRDRLRAPGDFITLELLGEPLLVRNCDGDVRAFQNVCAHRHARLTSLPCGSSPRIRCQYHGWEYDAEGRTCRVPDAPSFVPIRRRGEGLRRFRAATCGQLVFVSLRDDGPELREALGEVTWTLLEGAFGDEWAEVGAWTVEHAANWKIPVENSLESYHVPRVHPKTFKKLSHARDATHTLEPTFNALESAAPPAGALLKWISEQLRERPRRKYEHHHAYPSLMIARTDISSLAQFVLPTSATTSRSLAFCFAHRGDRPGLVRRALEPFVQRAVARYTHEVLREDNAIFASVQRGLRASQHAGVLGAREERVHAFQEYVARALP
jgi:choline monooxygenase